MPQTELSAASDRSASRPDFEYCVAAMITGCSRRMAASSRMVRKYDRWQLSTRSLAPIMGRGDHKPTVSNPSVKKRCRQKACRHLASHCQSWRPPHNSLEVSAGCAPSGITALVSTTRRANLARGLERRRRPSDCIAPSSVFPSGPRSQRTCHCWRPFAIETANWARE